MTSELTGDALFPPLPAPDILLLNHPRWWYPSSCAAGYGRARLRVWTATIDGDPAYLAVVTELGEGASVTNSAEHIRAVLDYALDLPLVVLEHYPAEQSPIDGEHLDQAARIGRDQQWRRIWPTPPTNPNHEVFETWMAVHGRDLLALDQAPSAPVLWGPHCSHDECGWHVCDHTGRIEHPCRRRLLGCPFCGEQGNQVERVHDLA
ncbi:hypothetical protein [Actinomadura miaoliensis]|uniref:Uncharacterized protein n=1 Tax=Actinomadura miaoliensis TaxID=430685 RepID=A0ABP7W7L1_9ACTN